MRYSDYTSNKKTPQNQPIFGSNQVQNAAGGYVYEISIWDRLIRFLILGSEGGSFYVDEQKLTLDNAKNVLECIKTDAARTVAAIVDVSSHGRAPKNDQAIYALALVATHADVKGKQEAYRAIPQVCRTGTFLFQFIQNITDMRGWSRGLRTAVSNWYLKNDNIEYQLAKYQGRNGWTQKDVVRLAHPKPQTQVQRDLLAIVVGKGEPTELTPIFAAMKKAKGCESIADLVKIIKDSRLTREMISTEFLNKPEVQDALLHSQPIGSVIRNLGAYSASGLLKTGLDAPVKYIRDLLNNEDALRKGRIHPYAALVAMLTYAQGHGEKGKLTWKPVQALVDALNEAFYLSFGTVEGTGKSVYLALDVSGSMGANFIGSGKLIDCRTAAAAMMLVTANAEKNNYIAGFGTRTNWRDEDGNEMVPLRLSPRDRIGRAKEILSTLPMGRTDCALPMLDALKKGLKVDAFVIYTDNETWAGKIHPMQALQQYRKEVNPNAKLVVVSMTPTGYSIGEQRALDGNVHNTNDNGVLDVVGFDTSVPDVIANFIK